MPKQILSALFERTVLIIERLPEVREMIAGAFQNFRCKVLLASSHSEAFNLIETQPRIDFVIADVGNPISNGFPFLEKLRTLDNQRPPVFFIADKRDADFDEAFFLGADAIFLQPIHFDELVKGVAFSYDLLVDHSDRKHKRRRVRRSRIQFSNRATGLSGTGYVMNLSAGGMYVSAMYNHPTANQTIDFKLIHESEPPIELSGQATIKWLRPIAEYGRPPGFGAEFNNLTPAAQAELQKIVGKG